MGGSEYEDPPHILQHRQNQPEDLGTIRTGVSLNSDGRLSITRNEYGYTYNGNGDKVFGMQTHSIFLPLSLDIVYLLSSHIAPSLFKFL
jgi:hypothetical protein